MYIVQTQLTTIMDQNMKSSSVDTAVAPGSGVDLRLEEGEVETLHIALAAGVAQGLKIAPVSPLVLSYQLLGKILAAACAASGRQCHFRLNTFSRENRKVLLTTRAVRLIRLAIHALGRAPNFSHGDISLVQHQFFRRFFAPSSWNQRPHTPSRTASLTFSFHGNSHSFVWGESVEYFACWKWYSFVPRTMWDIQSVLHLRIKS